MFQNYIKIAARNLWKNRIFSFVNIIGLAIGMATCLLIFQFVNFELSFDKFHSNYKNIYRVINTRFQNGVQIQEGPITYPTVGPAMAKEFSEIQTFTRLMPNGRVFVKKDEDVFAINSSHFVDEHFLSVLDFPLISGDAATALREPNTLMISKEVAENFFGVRDGNYDKLVGTTVAVNQNTDPYKITGVFEKPPESSHLNFDLLVSFKTLIRYSEGAADSSWQWSDFRHYLVLHPEANVESLEAKFKDFSLQYFEGEKVSGSEEKFFLQPLEKAHLNTNFEYDIAKTSDGKIVWTLAFVASFILVLAWINYINLTTFKALERAKEVGLRKAMGAFRGQLIGQFLAESMMINFLALLSAFTMMQVLQPYFNRLIDIDLSIFSFFAGNADQMLPFIVFMAFFFIGIILSAFYPAFILSSYQPVTMLKGKFQHSIKGNLLRKSLVIFQFIASVALITGTLVVFKQMKFIQNRHLGISLDDVMIIYGPQLTAFDSTFINRTNTFKHALKELAVVKTASTSNSIPGQRLGRNFNLKRSGAGDDQIYTVSTYNIDYDFRDLYNLQLLAGRNFSVDDHNPDFNALDKLIVNESLIKLIGFNNPQEVINEKIKFGDKEWTIVGVVTDFHQQSLRRPMEAMAFFPAYGSGNFISVKLNNNFLMNDIENIKSIYAKHFPGNSFDYFFLDERYNRQYLSEFRFSNTLQFFTLLAILIACLGLFGLSSHTISQRTKEIGIRKVLGASMQNIIVFLTRYYMKLIAIAGLLALPIAYFGSRSWLSNYVYRMHVPWWVYAIPIALILLIAFATISVQTIRAANKNPIHALRQD